MSSLILLTHALLGLPPHLQAEKAQLPQTLHRDQVLWHLLNLLQVVDVFPVLVNPKLHMVL